MFGDKTLSLAIWAGHSQQVSHLARHYGQAQSINDSLRSEKPQVTTSCQNRDIMMLHFFPPVPFRSPAAKIHTLTHTHSHTQPHTHTHIHTLMLTHKHLSLSHTHTHVHTHKCMYTRKTCIYTEHARTHAHSLIRPLIYTHSHLTYTVFLR